MEEAGGTPEPQQGATARRDRRRHPAARRPRRHRRLGRRRRRRRRRAVGRAGRRALPRARDHRRRHVVRAAGRRRRTVPVDRSPGDAGADHRRRRPAPPTAGRPPAPTVPADHGTARPTDVTGDDRGTGLDRRRAGARSRPSASSSRSSPPSPSRSTTPAAVQAPDRPAAGRAPPRRRVRRRRVARCAPSSPLDAPIEVEGRWERDGRPRARRRRWRPGRAPGYGDCVDNDGDAARRRLVPVHRHRRRRRRVGGRRRSSSAPPASTSGSSTTATTPICAILIAPSTSRYFEAYVFDAARSPRGRGRRCPSPTSARTSRRPPCDGARGRRLVRLRPRSAESGPAPRSLT